MHETHGIRHWGSGRNIAVRGVPMNQPRSGSMDAMGRRAGWEFFILTRCRLVWCQLALPTNTKSEGPQDQSKPKPSRRLTPVVIFTTACVWLEDPCSRMHPSAERRASWPHSLHSLHPRAIVPERSIRQGKGWCGLPMGAGGFCHGQQAREATTQPASRARTSLGSPLDVDVASGQHVLHGGGCTKAIALGRRLQRSGTHLKRRWSSISYGSTVF